MSGCPPGVPREMLKQIQAARRAVNFSSFHVRYWDFVLFHNLFKRFTMIACKFQRIREDFTLMSPGFR